MLYEKSQVNTFRKRKDMRTSGPSLICILGVILSTLMTISPNIRAQENEQYLIYDDFTLNDAMENRLRFGPTGAFGWVKDNHFVVRGLIPTSPADGKLIAHDVIIGANDKMFVEGLDPRPQLANAITQSETVKMRGKLTLNVIREGKPLRVNIQLDVMGTYSDTWPYDCSKSRKILDNAAEFVVGMQRPNGYTHWWWNPLVFISHPDIKYRENARRAAHYFCSDLIEFDSTKGHPYSRSLTSWRYSYKAIFLAEYYMQTGDETVLPALTKLIDWIGRGQMMCGTWAHRAPWGGYGAVNQCGLTCFIAMVLAKEVGVEVDEFKLQRAFDFFSDFVKVGTIPYGDHPPYGYLENQGKCALTSIAFRLLGKSDWSRIMGSMTAMSYHQFEYTHAGGMYTWLWSPLGAVHAPADEFRTMLDKTRWFYEFSRTEKGGMVRQPTPENLSGRTWGGPADPHFGTGALAQVYALPYKKTRLLGREKAPIVKKMTDPTVKEDIRLTIASIKNNIRKGDILLASEQIKALLRYRPDLTMLKTLEARIPKAKLAAERKAAESYFPHTDMAGWVLDRVTREAIQKAAAVEGTYYSKQAKKAIASLIPPKPSYKWKSLIAKGSSKFASAAWTNSKEFEIGQKNAVIWKDTATMTKPNGKVNQVLLKHTFNVSKHPEVLGLQMSLPDNARVYLNGYPVVQLKRTNLKKTKGKPWAIPLHPKAIKTLKKGQNELVVYIAKAQSFKEEIKAELVGATAKGATK